MITILAEKPSVAREIARIVGAMKREEGYFTGSGYHVTWALGHLVQLALPDEYGIRGFRRDSLPVIPERFELIPRQVKTDKGYKADAAAVQGGRGGGEANQGDNQVMERERRHHRGDRLCP